MLHKIYFICIIYVQAVANKIRFLLVLPYTARIFQGRSIIYLQRATVYHTRLLFYCTNKDLILNTKVQINSGK